MIKNIYRLLAAKKGIKSEIIECSNNDQSDAALKRIIVADKPELYGDDAMLAMLQQKVMRNKNTVSKNSLADFLSPLFSFRHIELKMAAITLIMVFSLGIGPSGNHAVNRNFNPGFLADTLLDSSTLNVPVYPEKIDFEQ